MCSEHLTDNTAPFNRHLKEELVLKIAILAERFRNEEHEWYVDVILALVKVAGDLCVLFRTDASIRNLPSHVCVGMVHCSVSEEIWYRVVQIITNHGDELQNYAAQQVWRTLTEEKIPHKTLVKIAGCARPRDRTLSGGVFTLTLVVA